MTADFKEIQQSALELDKKDRAELAKNLISSLDQEIDENIDQAWIEEIKRRKAEIKSGKVNPISGKEVHQAARELLKK